MEADLLRVPAHPAVVRFGPGERWVVAIQRVKGMSRPG
jgi:hypothetical protein